MAYDLITIGGGPAGLMCSLTATSGVPINPPSEHTSVLIVDRYEIGQFAKLGKLRLTFKWHLMGDELIARLLEEVAEAGIETRPKHRALSLTENRDGTKTVTTDRGAFEARNVAICSGFFPHGDLVAFRRTVRPVFSPVELEARVIPAAKNRHIAILGRGDSTLMFAEELKRRRPELDILVIEEAPATFEPRQDVEVFQGTIEAKGEGRKGLTYKLLDPNGKVAGKRTCLVLLIDYNAYAQDTDATDFLDPLPLDRRGGYLVTDSFGRTSIDGIVAAGNIVTPVSGALTALHTGFHAGLAVYERIYLARHGYRPPLFPWLPKEGLEAHPLHGQKAPVAGGRDAGR